MLIRNNYWLTTKVSSCATIYCQKWLHRSKVNTIQMPVHRNVIWVYSNQSPPYNRILGGMVFISNPNHISMHRHLYGVDLTPMQPFLTVVPHSTFYPVSNVPVNSGNLMETVNVLTSYVTAKQQQVMCNTSRTDMTAANNTRENISNYLQTNAINNMQHTVNMASCRRPWMELLAPNIHKLKALFFKIACKQKT
jgi:hypothetical protein